MTEYDFFPASVYPNKKIFANEIDEINIFGAPPEIKIQNELIFISAKYKDELEKFGKDNNIKMEKRFDIWDAILEIYLDTEISEDQKRNTLIKLKEFGLDEKTVQNWRKRVAGPMVAYNFGTMLWDWAHLGQWDMLKAHLLWVNDNEHKDKSIFGDLKLKEKVSKSDFEDLYWKSMEVALLAYK